MKKADEIEMKAADHMNARIGCLQIRAKLTDKDKKYYQEFWNIPDSDIDAEWLRKLEMHVNPTKATSVIFDMQPWESFASPSTGKVITSKAQRKEDMKASGCRDWEGLEVEKREASRARVEIEKKEDSMAEAAAIDVWKNME